MPKGRWCAPRGRAAASVPGFSAGLQARSRATLPMQTGASPPDLCQEQLRLSRALRGIPACSIPQPTSAPCRCSGRGLACQHCLPQHCWHAAALNASAGRLLCPMTAHPGDGHLLSKGPLSIHLPCSPPWHCTSPQKPSVQPVSLGQARRDAWLPLRAGSSQVQPNQSHPWGLLPTCGSPSLGVPMWWTLWLCGRGAGCQRSARSCSLPSPLLATHSLFSSMLSWGLRPCIFHPGASGCSPAPVPLPWRTAVVRAPREPPSRVGGPGARSAPGAARHSSLAPARPPSAISCCVAADLRAKSQRGPRARGTASCLRPLPPLARGAGRASPGALRDGSPAPWPERSAARASVVSALAVPVQGVRWHRYLQERWHQRPCAGWPWNYQP